MSVRPTARPEPFRAWTKSAYVEASPLRAPPIGGWRSLRFVAAPPPHASGGAHERPPKIPPRACRRHSRGAVLLRVIRRRSVAPRTAVRDRAMFGIVGDVGDKDAAPLLIEPLKRLEYREY